MRFGNIVLIPFLAALPAAAQCISGKWDTRPVWVRDCTSDEYDGWFTQGNRATTMVSGEDKVDVGGVTRTLSWRLHWYKNNLPQAPAIKAKIPLILGLHSWQQDSNIDRILYQESSLMAAEGSWEDVLFLTVALETGNNLNTWWWGGKVDNVPLAWAEEAILALLKRQIQEAPGLLAAAGAADLAGRTVDADRVYLRGHSMGGTGTYRMGIKHPEIFAAIHAHAGFADFKGGPCGNENFCKDFETRMVGTADEHLKTKGPDGKDYEARDFTDMSWFIGTHKGASWTASLGKGRRYDPPYIVMTHGMEDDGVDISSADRLHEVLKRTRHGYSYFRHLRGHSDYNFVRWQRLANFRRDLSFLAFTNNSTDRLAASAHQDFNGLDRLGWIPSTIVDQPDRYEVELTGSGKADVTLRRLQAFVVQPGKAYRWWVREKTGPGSEAVADADGVLTFPGVAVEGPTRLFVQSTDPTVVPRSAAPSAAGDLPTAGPGGSLRLPPSWHRASAGSWLEVADLRGRTLARLRRGAPASGDSGLWSPAGLGPGLHLVRGVIDGRAVSCRWAVPR